jgi:prepilin-type N-terminal cleavage/methylation domain-containing protein
MRMMWGTGRRGRGFTLIEFLFVIIIIGILVTASIPRLKKAHDVFLLNNFTSELRTFMQYLRERSLVEGQVIVLSAGEGEETLKADAKDTKEALKSLRVPRGLSVAADKKQVFFYPDGTLDEVTLTVTGAGGEQVKLTTKGIYGNVKVLSQEE